MEESHLSALLITFGGLLLLSPLAKLGMRALHVPQVTLFILLGVLLGPTVLDVVPSEQQAWYPAIAEVTLAMVGFLLGGEFTWANLRERGRTVIVVSLVVTVVTVALVAGGLWIGALGLPIALVLGSAAAATDPAACKAVVQETEAEGPLSRALLGIVAIDDLWGILVFSSVMASLSMWFDAGGGGSALFEGLREIGGAAALGVLLGGAMALVTGRLERGRPGREEAIGFVLLAAGLADQVGVSYLLTAVVMGATVANLAKHHEYTFREIEDIQWPFLVIFFLLSGSGLRWDQLDEVWGWALAYIALRTLGRAIGGWMGGRLAHMPRPQPGWMGLTLLPQAGVALGMTLVAQERFPSLGSEPLTIVVFGTVVFEIIGPVLTRLGLAKVGEVSGRKVVDHGTSAS